MNIDTHISDDYAILTLKGEFDTFHCPRFQEEIESVLGRGIDSLILSMRLVKFINSTALGAIIKASKLCKAEGGELVLSQASKFVSDIIRKVGIDEIVPLFDDEDDARKHIVKAMNARELSGAAQVSEEKVMITFPDDTRNAQIGGRRTLVGTMSNVDGRRVQFLWSGDRIGISVDQARQLFYKGSDLHLKFQLKLIKKGYFEVTGKVTEVADASDDNLRVTCEFAKIAKNEAEALSQFAADMDYLKRQLPGQ